MPSFGKVAKCSVAAGVPLCAAVLLLTTGLRGAESHESSWSPTSSMVRVTPPAKLAPEAQKVSPAHPARPANAHAAPRTAVAPELEQDALTLQQAVLDVDWPGTSVTDLQDLGTTLTQLLLQRPELGPAAAELLTCLVQRNVLFQVSHALRAVADDPTVHGRLLEIAEGTFTDEEREAAVETLGGRGDQEAIAAFGRILACESSPELTRTAACYELERDIDVAPTSVRENAAATARALVARPEVSERVRAESFDMLGKTGLDDQSRTLARAAITSSSTGEDLAIAAARALVEQGEPRDQVAALLRPCVQGDSGKEAMIDLLAGH